MTAWRIRITEHIISEMRRRRRAGESAEVIARDLGCAATTVRKFTRSASLTPVEPGEVRKRREAEAAKRLAEIPADTRDLTGRVFGDPLPGRSALDRRQRV